MLASLFTAHVVGKAKLDCHDDFLEIIISKNALKVTPRTVTDVTLLSKPFADRHEQVS